MRIRWLMMRETSLCLIKTTQVSYNVVPVLQNPFGHFKSELSASSGRYIKSFAYALLVETDAGTILPRLLVHIGLFIRVIPSIATTKGGIWLSIKP